MHQYLRAAGFSKYRKRSEIDKLIRKLVKDNLEASADSAGVDFVGDLRVEVRAYVADRIGLCMVGTVDKRGSFKLDAYYPFMDSDTVSSTSSVQIYERTQGEIFSGVFDDPRIGLTCIFLLDNPNDWARAGAEPVPVKEHRTRLAAFSNEGKILLPHVKKAAVPVVADRPSDDADKPKVFGLGDLFAGLLEMSSEETDEDRRLTQEMQENAFREMKAFASMSRRVQNEDIYSIVESSFMPHGVETDVYTVLGDIESAEKLQNSITGEGFWKLKINANDMPFYVIINELDLQGEPAVGRRFKGPIWMMGRTDIIPE